MIVHLHDDVIKWKHFPRYWSFVRGINPSPVSSLTKASDAEFWCIFDMRSKKNIWINTRDAGDLRRYRAHYDVTVMYIIQTFGKMTEGISWKLAALKAL